MRTTRQHDAFHGQMAVPLRRACLVPLLATFLWSSSAAATAITQAPQVNVGGQQVTVWWKTDVSASTEVAFGPTSAASFAAYPNQSIFSDAAGTNHSRTLRRVPPGTYFYRVRNTDGASAVESAEGTFVVPLSEAFPLGNLSFNGAVRAIAKGGNTWYLGGDFTSVGEAMGSGVAVDATTGVLLQNDFPEVAGEVRAVASDGAGGFYIGGRFTAVGGFVRNNAAHILPDQGVDPDWNPDVNGVNGIVLGLAVSGSTVYLGGTFTTVNGGTPRYDAVGSGRGQAAQPGCAGVCLRP